MTQEELEDLIAEAIDDSLDMDWTSRDGARHVAGALVIAGLVAPDDHPNATDYRNRAERAEAELAEARTEVERLRGAIQRCLEELYAPPANCSCHLSPPCSDCVEYAGIREAEEVARAALNGGKHD